MKFLKEMVPLGYGVEYFQDFLIKLDNATSGNKIVFTK